jgi:TolB-like protein/tetratricopeptide (TPR) repeat protein
MRPIRRLLAEIRRRKIIETSAAFIGGGWLFIEFVHWYLVDHFHLPERLLDIAFITVVGVFFGTLVWRWFRTGDRKSRRRGPEVFIIPMLVLGTIFLDLSIWLKPVPGREQAETPGWLNSIAVMPFADLSPAKDQDYFCEGMAEDIRTKLTRLNPRLKVISRYAMLPYREAMKPVGDVAHELGVKTILEGSVQKEGGRIRVNAQLINAGTGAHVWADLFDKTVASVFDVQDEISLAIVKSLELELAPGAESHLKADRPGNIKAYEYTLRGNYIIDTVYALKGREEDFDRALEMYRKAIELDPSAAHAFAGTAWAYAHDYTFSRKMEHAVLALENAKKAFDLAPNLPESQAAGGYYYAEQKDYDRAFECIRKALELSPNMMETLHLIGLIYQRLGLHDRAIKFFRKVLDLSPGYLFAQGNIAISCLSLGDYKSAEPLFNEVMSLSPGHPIYICEYADLLIRTGRIHEAEVVLDKAAGIRLGAVQSVFPHYRALLDAVRDRNEEALSADRSPEVLALSSTGDAAIQALEEIAKDTPFAPNYGYIDLLHTPYLASIRNDSRFKAILTAKKSAYDGFVKKYGDL